MIYLPKVDFNMPPGVSERDIPGNEKKRKCREIRYSDFKPRNHLTSCQCEMCDMFRRRSGAGKAGRKE